MVLSGFFPKNDSLEDKRLSYSGYFKEKVFSAIFKHISVNFGITVIIYSHSLLLLICITLGYT